MAKTGGTLKMKAGETVYFIGDPKKTGAGVPAFVCGLADSTATVSIEQEKGTRVLKVPIRELLPARLFTASVLRTAFNVYNNLERDRRAIGQLRPAELEHELQLGGLDKEISHVCAGLAREIDWIRTPCPLRAWLNAIRQFYHPHMPR
jgi:hypothetical protein